MRAWICKFASVFFAALFLLWGSHCGVSVGREYAGISDLKADLSEHVVVGRFGEHWPARVVEIIDGQDSVDFTKADGQRHSYGGFAGYDLKAIRLAGKKGEAVIVFRSKEKMRQPASAADDLNQLTR